MGAWEVWGPRAVPTHYHPLAESEFSGGDRVGGKAHRLVPL